jgi:hypothetical protein
VVRWQHGPLVCHWILGWMTMWVWTCFDIVCELVACPVVVREKAEQEV